ncbi:hypothetical protein RUND412_002545 [Rhizina undulata]
MPENDLPQRRIFICLGIFAVIILISNVLLLTGADIGKRIEKLPLPKSMKGKGSGSNEHSTTPSYLDDFEYDKSNEVTDAHPIAALMQDAAQKFQAYETGRSKTFAQAVKTYRAKYGRHPPPGFDKWYKFAREKRAFNIDDFDQIWDDLRPFWSIPPAELRKLVKGMLQEDEGLSGLGGIHVRNGKVTATNGNWRTDEFERMMNVFAKELPDMDIAMNKLDQPRVVVEWEDLQKHLAEEVTNRSIPPEVINEFTPQSEINDSDELPMADWVRVPGKPYMELASKACPPESYARNNDTMDPAEVEKGYKLTSSGGLITNFNASSDLCTVGPAIENLHGFLFSASSVVATKKLVPVFGECKVNVNNDILFPANMYYKEDPRYEYSPEKDEEWEDKDTAIFWRGITSGGVQVPETWRRLHRHRLVLMMNATELAATHQQFSILNWNPESPKTYREQSGFEPAEFAKTYADVGFPEIVWCVPDDTCGWLKEFLSEVSPTSMSDQFVYKYLIDIDGHSFSGRWHAFLKSRSLGLKATIFREWHDSRLFAWHHFVPMDNRFDDLYTLLTYFIGLGSLDSKSEFYVPSHDFEAKRIAMRGRDWANRVLRKEDIEIYMYRLMLEYGRLLDDNRDKIGYGGDGSEVEEKSEWNWD